MPQFILIVYVNRSGSTLLSRILGDAFENTYVFPELQFPLRLLTARASGHYLEGAMLYEAIAGDPRIDALAIDDETLRSICARSSSQNMQALLVELATASGGKAAYQAIAFKLESLLYVHDDALRAFPTLKTIHLVRDPRAVVSSMMASDLPERAGFNMARNSIVFAAMHWRKYVRRATAIALDRSMITAKYELLGADSDTALGELSGYLGIPLSETKSDANHYRIAELDRALHPNVFKPFIDERATAWTSSLSTRSIRIIEVICREEMQALGYSLNPPATPASWPDLVLAYIDYLAKIFQHSVRTVWSYSRRDRPLKQISERIRLYLREKNSR